MIKETARDYIVDAFRFYSALRRPNADAAQQKAEAFLSEREPAESIFVCGFPKPIDPQLVKRNLDAELADIRAVEDTLAILRIRPEGREILHAIETVYFFSPQSPRRRNDITDRVRCASLEIPASERMIYYYLALARRTFAEQRGLRISQKEPIPKLRDILSV